MTTQLSECGLLLLLLLLLLHATTEARGPKSDVRRLRTWWSAAARDLCSRAARAAP
jgi:hypothetical protein